MFTEMNFPTTNFYAKIDVNDTLNVKASLRIHKRGIKSNIAPYFNMEDLQSITIVYAKNAKNTTLNRDSIPAQNSIGRRQTGDELIHFQSRNITNMNRFPSKAFEYAGPDYITYVAFRFNVNRNFFFILSWVDPWIQDILIIFFKSSIINFSHPLQWFW